MKGTIREDCLLALATQSVIYMKGGAGTLQEVFQDTAQNNYHTFPLGPGKSREFSLMVFYGNFWSQRCRSSLSSTLSMLRASLRCARNTRDG